MLDVLYTPVDFSVVKLRQRNAWSTGDYAVVGTTLQIVGETLCESLDLRAGSSVLDVAAGNGNATLAAARRFCDVTSTDYVPSLLDAARRRAEAEGQKVTFQEADAEDLPFKTGTFDVVLSTFGVMFTPDQEQAAFEMVRVCKRGGRIGLANWTPGGFIGQVFRILGKYVPVPVGVPSPAQWGTRERLEELFENTATSITTTTRHFNFRFLSPRRWLEIFQTYYGPLRKAFATLDVDRQRAFTLDLLALMESLNRSGDRTLVLPSEYLEVVIETRSEPARPARAVGVG